MKFLVFIAVFVVDWAESQTAESRTGTTAEKPSRDRPFTLPIQNRKLQGHFITKLKLHGGLVNCQIKCYLEPRCVAISYKSYPSSITCFLHSSDHIQHPENLVERQGVTYIGTKNGCSVNNCSEYETCQPGLSPPLFTCDCLSGYTGQDCQTDKDECIYPSVCHVHATCTNTQGSYTCTCQSGYHGDGKNCLATGTSCHDINARDPQALDGLYYLNPGNHSDPFLAYCDMTTDDGGWTMCYTSNNTGKSKTDLVYDPDYPYPSNGYRSDCNNILFNEILNIKEGNQRETAHFVKDPDTPIRMIDSYGAYPSNNGKWKSQSGDYCLLICDGPFYTGFLLVSSNFFCPYTCIHWRLVGETSTCFRWSASTYSGVQYNKALDQDGDSLTMSVAIRYRNHDD